MANDDSVFIDDSMDDSMDDLADRDLNRLRNLHAKVSKLVALIATFASLDIIYTLMSWGQDSHSDSRTTFRFDGSHLVTVQNMS